MACKVLLQSLLYLLLNPLLELYISTLLNMQFPQMPFVLVPKGFENASLPENTVLLRFFTSTTPWLRSRGIPDPLPTKCGLFTTPRCSPYPEHTSSHIIVLRFCSSLFPLGSRVLEESDYVLLAILSPSYIAESKAHIRHSVNLMNESVSEGTVF